MQRTDYHRPPGLAVNFDSGSFRDPTSRVFTVGEHVYRYFDPSGAQDYNAFADSGLLETLVERGIVVPTQCVSSDDFSELNDAMPKASMIVEHQRIPFLSYAYEWPYDMLKAAALLHLELMNSILPSDFILKDATPYNVQFMGSEPKFIDVGSFEPYQEGTPWNAYAQFCRMFLNPLLLQSLTGVAYQGLLRSSLDGIDPNDLSRLLSLRRKLRKAVFVHVVLQAWLSRKFASPSAANQFTTHQRIQKKSIAKLISSLIREISRLKPRGVDSPWVKYDETNTYDAVTSELKKAFVERVLSAAKPGIVRRTVPEPVPGARGAFGVAAARPR